jgi:hypothetical protein
MTSVITIGVGGATWMGAGAIGTGGTATAEVVVVEVPE